MGIRINSRELLNLQTLNLRTSNLKLQTSNKKLLHFMRFLEKIIPNALFALHVLLVFLLVFESRVIIPTVLQPLGRMHPLLLHFPIGLLVLLGLMQLFRSDLQGESFPRIHRFILYIAAFTTVLTAIMGLFLSLEEGYAGSTLNTHKWAGVGVSFLVYAWVIWEERVRNPQSGLWGGLMVGLLGGILVTGHLGASLTHGEDFVWAPLLPDEEIQYTEETPAFQVAVAPILEKKCEGCHNLSKQKGELDMSTLAGLKVGGKNGPIWEAGDPDNSPMIQRALLPIDAEKHMPPEGKAQLTTEELEILHTWDCFWRRPGQSH